jgi:hypothetical protein
MGANRIKPPDQKEAPRGLLATIVITAGVVALGVYALDLHAHTCSNCGHRWRHLGAFNLGDEESHTCASCGQVQWWKCGTPHVLRGSQFVASPMLPSTPALPSFAHGTERRPPSQVYGRTSPSLPYERMGYERSSFGTAYDEAPPCEAYEQQLPSRVYEEAPSYVGASYGGHAQMSPSRAYERTPPSLPYEHRPPSRAYERMFPSRAYERMPPSRAYEELPPYRGQERMPPSRTYERMPPSRTYERKSPQREPSSRAYAALRSGTGDQEEWR